jgi:TPR repeat protein
MMYDGGVGVPQSYSEALSWYEMAAEKDNQVALFNIGVFNDAGLGQRRNSAEAVGWYERAAAKGSGRAAFNLALHYEMGDGVDQDDQQAERYFRQADRLGITGARSHLPGRRGRSADSEDADLPFNSIHAIGSDEPERRTADAVDRLQNEADQGDPLALYDLAYHLERGIGTKIDLRGAHTMYRKAAYAADDERLKKIADAAAARLKEHLTAAGHIQ